MNHCSRCNLDVDGPFCPECGALARHLAHSPGEPLKGAPGQCFECGIWQGRQRGIRVGPANRARFFSVRRSRIELLLDGENCLAELPDTFWTTCPEIRVAKDASGRNRLGEWLERNIPAGPKTKRQKGTADRVVLEVVVPEERFIVKAVEGKEGEG